jgi:hypothetical protein
MFTSISYKAALHNPRTSEAAKEHARKQLELLEGYNEEQQDEHNTRVLAGVSSTRRHFKCLDVNGLLR